MRHHNGPKSDMIMYCYLVVLFSSRFETKLEWHTQKKNFNSSHKHGLHNTVPGYEQFNIVIVNDYV